MFGALFLTIRFEPGDALDARRNGLPMQEAGAAQERQIGSESRHAADEFEQRRVALADIDPAHPGNLIILAEGIVIAALRAAHLVTHLQHGRSVTEQQTREKCPTKAIAKIENSWIVGWTLGAAVPTPVVVVTVLVALFVRLVVFVIVGDEVAKSETVMGSDEVDARPRPAPSAVIDIGRAGHAAPQGRQHAH